MRSASLLCCILFLVNPLSAETFRDVLRKNNIPVNTFSEEQLRAEVSSGNARTIGDTIYLAYLSVKNTSLASPIRLVKFNPSTAQAIYQELNVPTIPEVCLGSIWGIQALAGKVLIETHLNPSALCTLVVDGHMHYQATYMGWSIGDLGWGRALFREDQIHFAPVHPLRLAIVNVDKNNSVEIYPPKGDQLRREYSIELNNNRPPEQWCQDTNTPCEPEVFDSDVVAGPATDKERMNFTIILRFDADAFGEQAVEKVGTWFALYVFRRGSRGWNFCSRRLDDHELELLKSEGGLGGNNWHEWADTCRTGTKVQAEKSDLSIWQTFVNRSRPSITSAPPVR